MARPGPAPRLRGARSTRRGAADAGRTYPAPNGLSMFLLIWGWVPARRRWGRWPSKTVSGDARRGAASVLGCWRRSRAGVRVGRTDRPGGHLDGHRAVLPQRPGLLWTRAIVEIGAGLSIVLVNLQVVLVPLLAWLVDREPVTRRFLSHVDSAVPVATSWTVTVPSGPAHASSSPVGSSATGPATPRGRLAPSSPAIGTASPTSPAASLTLARAAAMSWSRCGPPSSSASARAATVDDIGHHGKRPEQVLEQQGLLKVWLTLRVWCLGRVWGLVDGLKLDRGELAERALASPPVVGGFDPGDDAQT